MTKDRVLKIAIGVLSIVILVYFFLDKEEKNQYNWQQSYQHQSKEPYGSYLLYELFKSSRSVAEFKNIEEPLKYVLDKKQDTLTNYIFVGKKWYFNEDDIKILCDYVARGNNAYIMSSEYPTDIIKHTDFIPPIYFSSVSDSVLNMELRLNEQQIKLSCKYVIDWKGEDYDWIYADTINDKDIVPLGYVDEYSLNYFELKHGKGSFFFHLNPLVFTNFHLRNEDNLIYANLAFENMHDGNIYWDRFSAHPYQAKDESKSPLSFILNQPSLRWAWYLILFAGLLYLIFYTKRKERPIPITSNLKNTTLEFVKTISGMYFQQEADIKILRHQKHLFMAYIKTHYGIPVNQIDDTFLNKVSLKSGIKKDAIDFLLKESTRLERLGYIEQRDLIEFNKLTDSFYRNCK